MRVAGLKTDANDKNRALYSLHHTATVTGIHAGISIETLATATAAKRQKVTR